jgi:ABC-type transport system substrate-binding protein
MQMMKSKKWLISLGLAVVLVVAFALPACEPTEQSGWYTPGGDHIEFEISATTGEWGDIALMVTSDLQDLGMDVTRRVIDSSTYFEYLYEPNLGGMESFIAVNDPGPDPWSDWIWMIFGDPLNWGYLWNPVWYNNPDYDELFIDNYLVPNLSAKEEVLYGMQDILAEDIPAVFLTRNDMLAVHRTDNWGNWYNEMGGFVSWINEWSLREVTKLGDETQLRIGEMGFPPNLNMNDSALTYTNLGCLYLMFIYENLTFYPKVGEDLGAAYDFVPKLATNFTLSYEDDGKGGQNQVWTVDLREGVKWHDYDTEGKNFTADDVVYTVQNAMSKWGVSRPVDWDWVNNTSNPNYGTIMPEDMLVEKTGTYQVTLTYIDGWHQNEDYFPSFYQWKPIVPKHKFEGYDPLEITGDCIGTGPYMVEEFVPDEYLLLTRFDDYWGPLPEPETILFRQYQDLGQMLLAIEAGEIDNIDGYSVPHQKLADYMANPDIEVDIVPNMSINWLGFNLHPTAGYEPFQDLALREAIAAAINKQNIVDLVHGGYGDIVDNFLYPESPNRKPDLPNNEYDPEAARQILLDAGYTYVE